MMTADLFYPRSLTIWNHKGVSPKLRHQQFEEASLPKPNQLLPNLPRWHIWVLKKPRTTQPRTLQAV